MKILSIDAWGNAEDGFEWNNWFHVGDIDRATFETLDTDAKTIAYMQSEGYLGPLASVTTVELDDDQYNVVVCDASTHEPLFAIEYGVEYLV